MKKGIPPPRSPLKIYHPKRRGSSSNHHFQGRAVKLPGCPIKLQLTGQGSWKNSPIPHPIHPPWNQHSTWKWMVGRWNLLLGLPIFRGYVSFRECTPIGHGTCLQAIDPFLCCLHAVLKARNLMFKGRCVSIRVGVARGNKYVTYLNGDYVVSTLLSIHWINLHSLNSFQAWSLPVCMLMYISVGILLILGARILES